MIVGVVLLLVGASSSLALALAAFNRRPAAGGSRTEVNVCAWCHRHVLGEGYREHGLVFCSWLHWLLWHVERSRNRGDDGAAS